MRTLNCNKGFFAVSSVFKENRLLSPSFFIFQPYFNNIGFLYLSRCFKPGNIYCNVMIELFADKSSLFFWVVGRFVDDKTANIWWNLKNDGKIPFFSKAFLQLRYL